MANTYSYPVYKLDTVGIVTNGPIWVRKIVYHPASAGQVAVLNFYDTSSPRSTGTKYSTPAVITSTTTITAGAGLLPNTILDGDVFEITGSNGAAANVNVRALVTTAGSGTAVVCSGAGWTNEGNPVVVTYNWTTYPQCTLATLTSQATTLVQCELDFGHKGIRFPNMILETIPGGAVHVYVA